MTMFLGSFATKAVSVLLILCIVALHAPAAAIGGDKSPEDALKQIQNKYYYRGKYTEAIDALRTFLARTDLSKNIAVSAREYLAASYILSGRSDAGKDQFLHLLNEDESYTGPDPSKFKAEVVEAFDSTRDALASVKLRTAPASGDDVASGNAASDSGKPIYKKWWFYVGLAAVVLLVAAAASAEETPEEGEPAPTGSVTVGVTVR